MKSVQVRSAFKPLAAATAMACAALLAAPAQAQFAERTIRMSNGINQDHPVGNGVAKMTACVTQKSGGKMKIQAFWGGALGGDLQATQALRSGTQEMVITSSSPLVGIVPELGVFDLPFLFHKNVMIAMRDGIELAVAHTRLRHHLLDQARQRLHMPPGSDLWHHAAPARMLLHLGGHSAGEHPLIPHHSSSRLVTTCFEGQQRRHQL